MNDSIADQPFNTTTSEAGAHTTQNSEGVAPVYIKQLLQANEGHFELFGLTFRMVSGVAIVRSQQKESTKIQYILEDHTGRIDASMTIDDDKDFNVPNLMVNSYARYYGGLRNFAGKQFIMIYNIKEVGGPNDVLMHALEVYHARYKAEQMARAEKHVPAEIEMDTGANQNEPGAGSAGGLTPIQKAVLQAIKNYKVGEDGVSMDILENKFRHVRDLNSIVEHLSNEGLIFSSIDDRHFLTSDC